MLDIHEYSYPLPPERIALYPLKERDQSKLLIYKRGQISHGQFTDLPDELPNKSILVFNNTKVIQARMLFKKESGAAIEIFLLHPVKPSSLLLDAMQSTGTSTWQCTIGNLKRWKPETTIKREIVRGQLIAKLLDREQGLVEFSWNNGESFASVISETGMTPLPPYLKREAESLDKERYQTIYSRNEGAVAAPTAGLHFTDRIFNALRAKEIEMDFLTLHVSAGTFQPVKEKDATRHVMHEEQVVITRSFIEKIIQSPQHIIPVGTTSMRSLESLYWYGVKLIAGDSAFNISQHDAYTLPQEIPAAESLRRIVDYMIAKDLEEITGETAIYIRPGYKFRVCSGLITNFHQPASTLILLVAAFIGDDWKKVYDQALNNDYRFLSYGDSSLLLP